MEESFRVRVEKVFGSLPPPPSYTSYNPTTSLWCLTDEEIEKREWNRPTQNPDDDEPKPYPPNLDGFFSHQPQLLLSSQTLPSTSAKHTEEEKEIHEKGLGRCELVKKPEDYSDEEWDIRSSVGLDPTLDLEEEEDPYDKLAVGRVESGDRLYVGDITDYRIAMNSCNELPNTLKDAARDSRANHMAAKLRLKEDAETTLNAEINLKYVTRRAYEMDTKSKKRVRFDPECKDYSEESFDGTSNLAMEKSSFVPDYITNPSRYTHYTFDDSSSDMDEDSNRKAFMDFLNSQKGLSANESQDEIPFDLPKSVMFIPKKYKENGCKEKKAFPTIVAVSGDESEICAMEEDEPQVPAANGGSSLRKTGRQYRTKVVSDWDEVS